MPEQNKAPDRRVLKTKRAIKNAFARLLSEKNINDITISDIAELADINRKTFYNYYSGIYEVVSEIEDGIVTGFEEALTDADFMDNFKNPYALLEKLSSVINTDLDFYGYLFSMESNLNLAVKIADLLKERTKTLILKSVDADEKKVDVMVDFLVSGLVAVYQHWFNSDRRDSIEEMSQNITELCYHGIPAYLNIDI